MSRLYDARGQIIGAPALNVNTPQIIIPGAIEPVGPKLVTQKFHYDAMVGSARFTPWRISMPVNYIGPGADLVQEVVFVRNIDPHAAVYAAIKYWEKWKGVVKGSRYPAPEKEGIATRIDEGDFMESYKFGKRMHRERNKWIHYEGNKKRPMAFMYEDSAMHDGFATKIKAWSHTKKRAGVVTHDHYFDTSTL